MRMSCQVPIEMCRLDDNVGLKFQGEKLMKQWNRTDFISFPSGLVDEEISKYHWTTNLWLCDTALTGRKASLSENRAAFRGEVFQGRFKSVRSRFQKVFVAGWQAVWKCKRCQPGMGREDQGQKYVLHVLYLVNFEHTKSEISATHRKRYAMTTSRMFRGAGAAPCCSSASGSGRVARTQKKKHTKKKTETDQSNQWNF